MNIILAGMIGLAMSVLAPTEEPMRAVIEQALDQPTELTIEDAPLPDAVRMIAEKTGLSVTVTPEALDYLPYGEATRVNVKMNGCRLREGIEAMCRQLAMSFETAPSGVVIVPSPPLERLGRPATWDELDVVSTLMNTRWAADSDYEMLRKLAQFRTSGDGPTVGWEDLEVRLRAAGAGRADEVLTIACESLGMTWHPWNENVVILPAVEQTARQLQQPVSLRVTHRPVSEVLQELSRQTGVKVTLDPAAAAQLPPQVKQNFTILVEGATAEEALLQIGIAAGLSFTIEPDTVTFHAPETAQSQGSGWRTGDLIVGKVIVPSEDGHKTYEFFIRESDLTPEENARRKELVKRAAQELKEELLPTDSQ